LALKVEFPVTKANLVATGWAKRKASIPHEIARAYYKQDNLVESPTRTEAALIVSDPLHKYINKRFSRFLYTEYARCYESYLAEVVELHRPHPDKVIIRKCFKQPGACITSQC
jgi:hypothetical protein